MKLKFVLIFLFCSLKISAFPYQDEEKPFVTAYKIGQFGNNMFQVATACALAWDNNAEPCFLDFDSNSLIYRHIFFRFNNKLPPEHITFRWFEPTHAYCPIPYHPNMQIIGYFQTEKYFAHYRDRFLELFAPHTEDLAYIQEKYDWLLTHPNTVGVQIRDYNGENIPEGMFPQYGKDYLEKAMAIFPESSLFVVSSNNLSFARENIPKWANVVFLENEPSYIDFHLLSYCKHNIITNSSFGWWSAWLNQNPDKIVVRPAILFNGFPTHDYCPEEWLSVDAEYECAKNHLGK